jgi:hypothetical protein
MATVALSLSVGNPAQVQIEPNHATTSVFKRYIRDHCRCALAVVLLSQTSTAQARDHAERKVVSQVAPFYPEIAKRMHVTGVVKIEVVRAWEGKIYESTGGKTGADRIGHRRAIRSTPNKCPSPCSAIPHPCSQPPTGSRFPYPFKKSRDHGMSQKVLR